MNVNVKISIDDAQRRTIHENFYGGKKGMISRADVNAICQAAITDWLMKKKQIGEKVADAMQESISMEPLGADVNVEEVMKQNKLLLTRVNRLQHRLDTTR